MDMLFVGDEGAIAKNASCRLGFEAIRGYISSTLIPAIFA